MAMDRRNPFRDVMSLREAMDRLFEDSFVRPVGQSSGAITSGFPLDVAETDNNFVVRASLPGIKPDDLHITVHGDTLTIRGELQADEERPGHNWLIREHRAGAFQRAITLPAPVNPDGAEAQFEHGVLVLTLPKAEAAKPRQIRIGGQASGQAQVAAPGGAAGRQSFASPPMSSAQAGREVGVQGKISPSRGSETPGGSGASGSAGTPGTAAGTGGAARAAAGGTRSRSRGGARGARGDIADARTSSAAGDVVTRESQESFPASDPPSWTPERA